MKKQLCLVLTLCLLLAGCGKTVQMDKTQTPWTVPSALLGQPIKAALQKEWDWWNGLGEDRIFYSRMDACSGQRSFDSWADCEEFTGLTIPNPLEDCDWLEKGTYVGMPIGFADARRMEVNWFGGEEGHFCRVTLCCGYYTDAVRLQVWARVYGDPTNGDCRYGSDALRTEYLEATGGTGAYIVEDDHGCNGTLAKGHVLYYINAVAQNGQREAARTVLEDMLALVETIPVE